MAKLSTASAAGPWGKGFEVENKALQALIKASLKNPERVLGSVYSAQVGDGRAYYLVVKEKPLTLAHIPVGDAWELNPAYIRGIKASDIIDRNKWEKMMRDIF